MNQPPRRTVTGAASSLWGSLRELAGTAIDYGKSQLQQLGDGMEQEVGRAAEALLWAAFVAMLCCTGLLMAALTVVIAFWDSPHRLLTAILATASLFVLAGIGMLIVRKKLRRQSTLLGGATQAALLLAAYKRLIG